MQKKPEDKNNPVLILIKLRTITITITITWFANIICGASPDFSPQFLLLNSINRVMAVV